MERFGLGSLRHLISFTVRSHINGEGEYISEFLRVLGKSLKENIIVYQPEYHPWMYVLICKDMTISFVTNFLMTGKCVCVFCPIAYVYMKYINDRLSEFIYDIACILDFFLVNELQFTTCRPKKLLTALVISLEIASTMSKPQKWIWKYEFLSSTHL